MDTKQLDLFESSSSLNVGDTVFVRATDPAYTKASPHRFEGVRGVVRALIPLTTGCFARVANDAGEFVVAVRNLAAAL